MGKVQIDVINGKPVIIEYNDEWSFNRSSISYSEMPSGITVYATSFYLEKPDSEIFNPELKNVKFVKCNLDNILIPPNNELIESTNERFEVQNDLNDWLINDKNLPLKPFNYKVFEKFNLPIPEAKDIPIEKVTEPIDWVKEKQQMLEIVDN